jgi:putative flippase GtrA
MGLATSGSPSMQRALSALKRSRFMRFLAVGFLNTIFGYSIYTAVYLAWRVPTVAIVVATIIGVLFNFFTTGRIVFDNRRLSVVLPFIMAYGVSMLLNIALVNMLLLLGIGALVAQALSLPFVVVATYLINARLVFRD